MGIRRLEAPPAPPTCAAAAAPPPPACRGCDTGEDVPAPRRKASCPRGTDGSSRNQPKPRGEAGPNSRGRFQSKAPHTGRGGQRPGRQGPPPQEGAPGKASAHVCGRGSVCKSEEGLQETGSRRLFWAPGRAHPTESGGEAEGPLPPVPYPPLNPLQMGQLRDSPK